MIIYNFLEYFIIEKEVGKNNMNTSNFIIFPIEHFPTYFDVTALYRCKKSGSSNPSEKTVKRDLFKKQNEMFSIKKTGMSVSLSAEMEN